MNQNKCECGHLDVNHRGEFNLIAQNDNPEFVKDKGFCQLCDCKLFEQQTP